MDTKDIIREILINPRHDINDRGLIIIASEAIAKTKDEKALPYLIYTLARNNFIQDGNEDTAVIHTLMIRKLADAIQKITDLEINVAELDVDNPGQVNKVLSMAKSWAKQKGIKLFEENK